MSFKPVVTLTQVARDNSSYTLTDATPTNGTDGYGSSNAPANAAAVTSLYGMVQPYADLPVNATGVVGNLSTVGGFKFAASIFDGVNTFSALYGLQRTFTDFVISADGTKITSNDPSLTAKLDGVSYLNIDGTVYPVAIASIVGNLITLSGTLTPNASGTTLYVYFKASVMAMTLNNGEALCVNGISLLPVDATACDDATSIFHNIMLKLGAEIAFGCGLFAKAHEAARLLGGGISNTPPNCTTCG